MGKPAAVVAGRGEGFGETPLHRPGWTFAVDLLEWRSVPRNLTLTATTGEDRRWKPSRA